MWSSGCKLYLNLWSPFKYWIKNQIYKIISLINKYHTIYIKYTKFHPPQPHFFTTYPYPRPGMQIPQHPYIKKKRFDIEKVRNSRDTGTRIARPTSAVTETTPTCRSTTPSARSASPPTRASAHIQRHSSCSHPAPPSRPAHIQRRQRTRRSSSPPTHLHLLFHDAKRPIGLATNARIRSHPAPLVLLTSSAANARAARPRASREARAPGPVGRNRFRTRRRCSGKAALRVQETSGPAPRCLSDSTPECCNRWGSPSTFLTLTARSYTGEIFVPSQFHEFFASKLKVRQTFEQMLWPWSLSMLILEPTTKWIGHWVSFESCEWK
jgi:hypothetical protein